MRKLPFIVLVLLLCVGAAIVAPLVALLFGAEFRGTAVVRSLIMGLVYSASVGLPSTLVLPLVARRVGKPGRRLAMVMAVTILALALAGTLAGTVTLRAVGIAQQPHLWDEYLWTVRITATLSLLFGMSSYFYEALASELRESRALLQEKALAEERARKLALEAKLSSLESRIHPHFLFNTLNSISALIPVDPERAEELVGRLAALLRSSLDSTQQPLIPLETEMQIVRDHIDIERARFGDRLRCSFEVAEAARKLLVPPLSVQSLVENAVKHGGREIRVVGRVEPPGLRVEVCDSGPGFDLSSVSTGHGLDNLISRLDALFGPAARLEVTRRNGECVVALVVP